MPNTQNNTSRGNQGRTDSSTRTSNNSTGGRGFAGMDPERQREISAMGGRASHEHDDTASTSKSRSTGAKSGSGSASASSSGSGKQSARSSDSDDSSSSRSGSTRGGTHEQHVAAGRQSHKNS